MKNQIMLRTGCAVWLLCLLYSCNPGFGVVLSNQSAETKQVKLLIDKRTITSAPDSVTIVNAAKRMSVPVVSDTGNLSFSFLLGRQADAYIDLGAGSNFQTKKIIVDDLDTFSFPKDNRIQVKKQFLSTSYLINLK